MPNKKNNEFDVEDILSSLDDDEEIQEDEDLDILSILEDLDEQVEEEKEDEDIDVLSILEDLDEQVEEEKEAKLNTSGLSFNDYAKSLIADLEGEIYSNNNSNEEADVISALEDLDDEEDEYSDLSIEELFNEFVDSVKKLSDNEKDTLEEKVNKNKILETSDLTVAGLTISTDGIITATKFNKDLRKLTIKKSYNGILVRQLESVAVSMDDDIMLEQVIIEGDVCINSCFEGCPNLNDIISKGKIEIGSYNFVSVPELLTISNGCDYIRVNGFDYYALKKGVYKSPKVIVENGCQCICSHAFLFSKIEAVQIPSSVKTICKSAFAESYELKNVSLSEGLEYINESAFNSCRALKSIDIPSSVVYIGNEAFAGCDNLVEVKISRKCKFESDSFPQGVRFTYK